MWHKPASYFLREPLKVSFWLWWPITILMHSASLSHEPSRVHTACITLLAHCLDKLIRFSLYISAILTKSTLSSVTYHQLSSWPLETFPLMSCLSMIMILFVAGHCMLILASYSKIITTILKWPRAAWQAKAFSICSLIWVCCLWAFRSVTITYLRLKSTNSPGTNKLFSLLYTIVICMFNSFFFFFKNIIYLKLKN